MADVAEFSWDPVQYNRFSDERGRPFADLLARVALDRPAGLVVDLGCGSGELTAGLLTRWPSASVIGVDSSAEMIAAADRLRAGLPPADAARLRFIEADLSSWTPPGPVDVITSNAALQWVPGHLELLPTLMGRLAPGGRLAVQVPGNHDAPAHALLRELRRTPRWSPLVGPDAAPGLDRRLAVAEPADYLATLARAGFAADVWETTYLHLLTGEDAVLQWMRGTGARPTLAALPDDPTRAAFEADYAALLRDAYPPQPFGTVMPFRRLFLVGSTR
ncbi:MAG: methyltransferase domain-containing protein [Kineosporiaceae bacterium]|nr:methyltransferase domain-containing protein [Kineosporiaceae bacterium]